MFFIKGTVGYLVMHDEFDMLLSEAIVKALELRERAGRDGTLPGLQWEHNDVHRRIAAWDAH